jgi:hypothetical protein
MSKTGRYRFIDGEWIKTSDKPPRLVDAYVPAGGYVDEHLGRYIESKYDDIPAKFIPAQITSREQKATLMKERGVVEDGGFKKPVRRKYFGA